MKHFINFAFIFFTLAVFGQDWKETYAEAISIANEQSKPVILVFAGSDWCAPCIRLDRDIWQSKEFSSYALENYILYKADFPRKKGNKLSKAKEAVNNQLAEIYNPKGYFPLVVVIDKNETVLGKTGYKKIPVSEYISLLNSFNK